MIKDLYYGNIIRSEHSCKDTEYQKLMQYWLTLSGTFERMLTPDQLKLFNEIVDTQEKCNEITSAGLYEIGFRDGASLIFDILKGMDTK